MSGPISDPKALGAAIRQRRRTRGWTQAEVAERAAVSRRFVSALETGERTGAEIGRVFAVLRALDTAVELLDRPRSSFDDSLREILG